MLLVRASRAPLSCYKPALLDFRFYCTSTNHKYGDTLLLPKNTIPMVYSAAKEGALLYDPSKLYTWQLSQNPGSTWITHDGPPYANGDLHLGHVFNKSLKDFINRYKSMRGHKVSYVPGWDCHGLPIELQAMRKLQRDNDPKKSAQSQKSHPQTEVKSPRDMSAQEIRKLAREYALEQVANQKQEFMRLGIMGDWSSPYLTLDPQYCASQLQIFSTLYAKGYVYRGVKPVHWSPSSRTALADAELEYNDNHVSPSVYVSFPVVKFAETAKHLAQHSSLKAVIWTTTPWTLPANMAIAVSADIEYCVVRWQGVHYLVAHDRLEHLKEKLQKLGQTSDTTSDWKVVESISGSLLEHTQCTHPLNGRLSQIILSSHVTTAAGTGLVHTAPGHGEEDFAAGKKYNLQVLSPVDAFGNFTEEVGDADLVGKFVLSDGNKIVIDKLKMSGALLAHEPFTHKYPYDWRTKKPVIVRATAQWFVDLSHVHEKAVESIQSVHMHPPTSRLASMVTGRTSWCISRQRVWGVPIPVFYDRVTGEPLLNEDTLSHILDLVKSKGSDVWWDLPTEELLHPKYRENGNWVKGSDTMDVWFDSGVSWAAVLQARNIGFPADLYLEGSDQHRGWFQSSLLTSICAQGVAPYKSIVTHGFLLDEKGQKMAKSLGNTIVPSVIIHGGKDPRANPAFGVDVLRLLVASSDYTKDITVGPSVLLATRDSFSKIRNTLRFAIGNTGDFSYPQDAIPYQSLANLDKYILHKLHQLGTSVTSAYDAYHFTSVFRPILNFCTVDLSAFYFSIIKMGLYVDLPNSARRRSAQTVLYKIIETINKAWAPFVPHAAEEIHTHWTANTSKSDCIFTSGWLSLEDEWNNSDLANQFQSLVSIRDEVIKLLEVMRAKKIIGRQEEAEIDIHSDSTAIASISHADLDEILQVSALRLHHDDPEQHTTEWTSQFHVVINGATHTISIFGRKASMEKCPRCWRHHSSEKNEPCNKCRVILSCIKS